jgi:hypothetical protein
MGNQWSVSTRPQAAVAKEKSRLEALEPGPQKALAGLLEGRYVVVSPSPVDSSEKPQFVLRASKKNPIVIAPQNDAEGKSSGGVNLEKGDIKGYVVGRELYLQVPDRKGVAYKVTLTNAELKRVLSGKPLDEAKPEAGAQRGWLAVGGVRRSGARGRAFESRRLNGRWRTQ